MDGIKRYSFLLSSISVVLISVVFILIYYGSIVLHPNSTFLKEDGDGLKNYYTYSYFINQNESNVNLEGMNYPYGENFLYTDCHPILALTLKKASAVFPFIGDYTIGILNSLLFLSFILCAYFLFLIFYELKVQAALAVLGAVGIMVLAPQVFRLGGHYALSYACFFPIQLYLLLRHERNDQKSTFLILLLFNNLFWLFVHAYLGMILIGFTIVYFLIKLIQSIVYKRKNYRELMTFLLSIIVPIIVFLTTLKITDSHIGRTTNAGDLLEHSANLFTVFLPFKTHFLYSFFHGIFKDTKVHWEDIAYIGLLSDLVLLGFVIYLVKAVLEKKSLGFAKGIETRFLFFSMISALVLLLFAMDLPFVLGLEGLLDLKMFSVIKDFRANGRFAWAFYFMATILSVYLVNLMVERLADKNKKVLALAILFFYPASLIFEGTFNHKHVSKRVSGHKNLFDIELVDPELRKAISSIDQDKYQAILPLPFFHTGSQNFEKFFRKEVFTRTLITSYHTGIPTFASQLTRVSIPESKSLMQLLSERYYTKEIKEILVDKRPVLIIRSKEGISNSEKSYLGISKLIYDGSDFQFYELGIDFFFAWAPLSFSPEEELNKFESMKHKLFLKEGFQMSDTSSYFHYRDYEEFESAYSYRGEGSFSGPKKDSHILLKIDGRDLELNSDYIARLWMYNCGENHGQDQLFGALVLEAELEEGEKWNSPKVEPRFSQEIDGCWSLVELKFRIKTKKGIYSLKILPDQGSKKTLYIDDLLIYKKGNMIYFEETYELFKNNHKIRMWY